MITGSQAAKCRDASARDLWAADIFKFSNLTPSGWTISMKKGLDCLMDVSDNGGIPQYPISAHLVPFHPHVNGKIMMNGASGPIATCPLVSFGLPWAVVLHLSLAEGPWGDKHPEVSIGRPRNGNLAPKHPHHWLITKHDGFMGFGRSSSDSATPVVSE